MKKKAFSMIELTIVLIILGIISAGVIKGSSMINVAKLTTARSITSKSIVPNIEGLLAWYETTAIDSFLTTQSYDAAQISTWYDSTPASLILRKNSLTRTASSALTYQKNGINNLPSLYFQSSANITLSQFYQGSSAHNTVFIVFRPTVTVSSDNVLIDSYSTGSTSLIEIKNQNVYVNRGSGLAVMGTTYSSAVFTMGNDYIIATYLNDAASKAYVNNAATVTGNSAVNPGTNMLAGLTIGTNKSGSNAFTGLISEIIIYNRPLQNKERQDVFRYLSMKYKIPVLGL